MSWRTPMFTTLALISLLQPLVAAEPPAPWFHEAPVAASTDAQPVQAPPEASRPAPVLLAQAPPQPVKPKNPLPKVKPQLPTPPATGAAALAEKVQSFYEHTRDFSASFTQQYKYKAMARTQKSAGTVQVKKPGLMRWDYTAPYEKLFLLDGKALWVWDPEDNAVMVNRSFSSDQLSAAVTFLWGKGKLSDEFDIQQVDKPSYGETVLELVPKKPQSGFTRLYFAIDANTGAVVTSVVIDSQGNENRITFTDVKTNAGVPSDRFTFQVPKGATVQEL